MICLITDTHVKDSLYPYIEKAFKNKDNIAKLEKHISSYFDKNHNILFDMNFSDRLLLGESDKNLIFDMCGITSDEVSKIIKQSKYDMPDWVSNPFTIMMALAIRYLVIHKLDKTVGLCVVYVSCMYYVLLHPKIWKYPPSRTIMDYTLNNNENVTNSFIIKKEGSIIGLIRYTGMGSHEFYEKDIIGTCTDVQLNNYLSAIRTRLSSNLKNIAKYFYEDHKQGHYFNMDTDSYDEDDFHMATNVSLAISKLSSKVATNISSYRFPRKFIDMASATEDEVSAYRLTYIMDNIIEYFRQDLDKFTSTILELFIHEGNAIEEVKSLKFLAHALNIYKTNSTKQSVIQIKDYLDKWIEDGSMKSGNRFIRPATVHAYRRAIYTVFVYTINKEAK